MDRQGAIEILRQYQKWELKSNHCKSDFYSIIHYSADEVSEAIDILITPIPVTDEMVGRANDVYLGKERTDVFREDYDKMKAALIAALGGDDVKGI